MRGKGNQQKATETNSKLDDLLKKMKDLELEMKDMKRKQKELQRRDQVSTNNKVWNIPYIGGYRQRGGHGRYNDTNRGDYWYRNHGQRADMRSIEENNRQSQQNRHTGAEKNTSPKRLN